MKTAQWSLYLIFLVIHLPARTGVESPSLEGLKNVWMWPWRTWFSGDHGGCTGWPPESLPTLRIPWFGLWAHRPSLVRTSWRNLSLQHSSPKAEVFSPLTGCEVNKSCLPQGFVPSTRQPFVSVTSLALELWKPDWKQKAFGSSLRGKHTFLQGARAVFVLEVVLGKPRGCWSTELILDVGWERERMLLGCSAKRGLRGWVRSESPRGVQEV